MRVHIVRHGKATDAPEPLKRFPRPEGYSADFDRPLTTRGESQARFLAEHMRTAEHGPSVILTSRYPRAYQTAEIIHALTPGTPLKTAAELEVDHPVSEALALIAAQRDARSIMLVGHNPQLGELIGVLCSSLPPDQLLLKTGEMVVIDTRPGQPLGSGKVVARTRMGDETAAPSIPAPLPAATTARGLKSKKPKNSHQHA